MHVFVLPRFCVLYCWIVEMQSSSVFSTMRFYDYHLQCLDSNLLGQPFVRMWSVALETWCAVPDHTKMALIVFVIFLLSWFFTPGFPNLTAVAPIRVNIRRFSQNNGQDRLNWNSAFRSNVPYILGSLLQFCQLLSKKLKLPRCF